ncbi:MAG: hypothetical protein NZM40_02760 [Sphingomonadaceae bacterium]|uniref:hypothetical protein n=1 Tax=Thermaurantiacus sp. TaxID=2820283 RepID=UPI00298EF34B|nr:hypothetical protein [Thermaurantiacus sp.]MCS6986346.1 hypothetical protein [Sphingomonadaceae bacterium]MDW8414392.1 hypothetical protein [Thermaurantiacus sp.]
MTRHRREIAQQLATGLFDAEIAIDQALAKAAALMSTMPTARLDARVSATVGQPAVDHVAAAIAALSAARAEMVKAHHAFADLQAQFGLGAVNFGAGFIKPEYPKENRALHVVEAPRAA